MSDCTDKPPLMVPILGKLDLPRFILDLPKYKLWLSPVAWMHWDNCMKKADELGNTPDLPWDIHQLISMAIVSISTPPTEPQLSGSLAALRKRLILKSYCTAG